jgi:hypothetical protein
MNQITLHGNSKYNKSNYTGTCVACLETATFRHVMFNGTNSIMCTRCLTAKPLRKGLDDVPYMYFNEALTFKDKFTRFKMRLMDYFIKGRHNRKRFDIRILKGL